MISAARAFRSCEASPAKQPSDAGAREIDAGAQEREGSAIASPVLQVHRGFPTVTLTIGQAVVWLSLHSWRDSIFRSASVLYRDFVVSVTWWTGT